MTWVELGVPTRVDAETIRRWFHENIVCRYRVPGIVRTDRGSKFKGEFCHYLLESGVRQRVISTQNPRKNGKVERFNQTIEANLQKFAVECPGGNWWEFV